MKGLLIYYKLTLISPAIVILVLLWSVTPKPTSFKQNVSLFSAQENYKSKICSFQVFEFHMAAFLPLYIDKLLSIDY